MSQEFKIENSAKNINGVVFVTFLIIGISAMFYSIVYINPINGNNEFSFYYFTVGIINITIGLILKTIIDLLIEISTSLKLKQD